MTKPSHDLLAEAKEVLRWSNRSYAPATAGDYALVSIAESLTRIAGPEATVPEFEQPTKRYEEEYDVPESYFVDHDTGSAYWLAGDGSEIYFAPLMRDGSIAWGDASEVDGRADQDAIDYVAKLAGILVLAVGLKP